MKKFSSLLEKISSKEISQMSKKELRTVVAGDVAADCGSQTSGTGDNQPPCDNTCVCRCTQK